MNNSIMEGAPAELAVGSAVPVYFPSGSRSLFGWLHGAVGLAPPRLGLVLCNPFGYEAQCAHRSLRVFAQTAAALGIPALRFDYSGTGDSEDIGPNADQIALWTADVAAAVAALQQWTAVERVCVLGVRLGALLASLATARCRSSVGALIAVAPVVSGRRYLREMRTMQLAAAQVEGGASNAAPKDLSQREPGWVEAGGYVLSATSVAALSGVDLLSSAPPAPAEVLVIDRDDLPGARPWADALMASGARTEYRQLPGFVKMAMTGPEYAVVPHAMVAAVRECLSRLLRGLPEPAPTAAPKGVAPPLISQVTLSGHMPGATLTEYPVRFGDQVRLFGIVTRPPVGERRRRAVILLNAGADQHVGPCRLHVSLARSWARRGYTVLRMDMAGIGDSETRPGRRDDQVHPPEAVPDVRAALSFMVESVGARDVTLAGLCSGAYHSLRAAVAGVPVNRILMVNPLNFFWSEGKEIDELQLAEVVANPRLYRQRVLSSAAWKRLLAGQVNVWRIMRIHLQRPLLATEVTLRDWARRLRIPLPRDLGYDLESVAARGVQIVFAFAHGEAGIDLLKLQAGSSVKRLGDRCRVHIIDGADHIFTHVQHRQMLEEVLSEELSTYRPPARTVGGENVPTDESCESLNPPANVG